MANELIRSDVLKIVTIEKTDKPDCLDISHPNWKQDTCYYILTYLASMPSGCITAEWSRANHEVIWNYMTRPCYLLKPDSTEGQILVHKDVSQFRMILAAWGNATLDDTYIGAGTFRIKFKDETEDDKLYAIIFGNERGIGYWIQLRVVNELVSKE
jgi:hypothetical protein